MMEWDDQFKTDRTVLQSFSGYLTLTRDGGYSYTSREDDSTRVRAMERLVNIKPVKK